MQKSVVEHNTGLNWSVVIIPFFHFRFSASFTILPSFVVIFKRGKLWEYSSNRAKTTVIKRKENRVGGFPGNTTKKSSKKKKTIYRIKKSYCNVKNRWIRIFHFFSPALKMGYLYILPKSMCVFCSAESPVPSSSLLHFMPPNTLTNKITNICLVIYPPILYSQKVYIRCTFHMLQIRENWAKRENSTKSFDLATVA